MDIRRLGILLDKRASGSLSPTEKNELEAWYRAFDEQTVRDFLSAHPEESARLQEEMLAALHQRIQKDESKLPVRAPKKKPFIRFTVWRIAAACVIILAIGIWIGYYYPAGRDGQMMKLVTTKTLKGQRSLVMLSDGSKVYLNAESRLIYPSKLKNDRVVYLEGEAFFMVPDDERPLIIKTSGIATTVKASDFNISAFPEDSTITVAVKKGEARISSDDKTHPMMRLRMPAKRDTLHPKTVPMATLRPAMMKLRPVREAEAGSDEYITYNKQRKIIDISDSLDSKALFGWKDGIIYFRNADTSELINKLERWYGVSITLNTKGAALPLFSGEFDNEGLDNVLRHISNQFDLNYTIAGKNVYLDKRMN